MLTVHPLLAPRVRAGVAVLDAVDFRWPLLVDEHSLDVWSDTKCPLGQMWGSFSRGLKALGIAEGLAADFGFESPAAVNDEDDSRARWEYDTLTRLWRYVVRKRTDAFL